MPGHRERYTQPPRGQQQTFKVEQKQLQSQHNHSGGSRDGPAPAPAPIPAGDCPGLTVNSSSWLLSCTLLAKPDGVQCLPPALSIFRVVSSQEPSVLCPPYLYATPIQASNLYLLSHSESGHSVSHFLVARLSEPLAYVQ